VDTPPVVTPTGANIIVSHSTPVAASSLFTASDADGDSITQYDLYDNGAGGGHWLLNGTALANGQIDLVSAAQLTQVSYQSGAGTDTLYVRASDDLQFGAWQRFMASDTAPVVTPTGANIIVSH